LRICWRPHPDHVAAALHGETQQSERKPSLGSDGMTRFELPDLVRCPGVMTSAFNLRQLDVAGRVIAADTECDRKPAERTNGLQPVAGGVRLLLIEQPGDEFRRHGLEG
jgi:hypothetical protein